MFSDGNSSFLFVKRVLLISSRILSPLASRMPISSRGLLDLCFFSHSFNEFCSSVHSSKPMVSQVVILLSHDSKPHHHYSHNLVNFYGLISLLKTLCTSPWPQRTNTNSLSYIQILHHPVYTSLSKLISHSWFHKYSLSNCHVSDCIWGYETAVNKTDLKPLPSCKLYFPSNTQLFLWASLS